LFVAEPLQAVAVLRLIADNFVLVELYWVEICFQRKIFLMIFPNF
jgi:hypothetical protein